MRVLPAVLLVASAVLCGSTRAEAFSYLEHQEIVCSAVDKLCTDEKLLKDPADRPTLLRGLLCAHACGKHPEHPDPKPDKNKPVKLPRQVADDPWVPLFADRNCHLDLGDAVALVDFANLSTLSSLTCSTEDRLREDAINYGIKSLFADEHFCPVAPSAYAQYHHMAIAAALLASTRDPALDDLRSALLNEAYGLHFFTDNFSAGHLRARLQDTDDNVVTKRVHDYYCEHGLAMRNGLGETWTGYGDDYLSPGDHDSVEVKRAKEIHKRRVIDAVYESLHAVVLTFLLGNVEEDKAAMKAPECIARAKLDSETMPGDFYQYEAGLRLEAGLENWDFGNLVPTRRWHFRAVLDKPVASWWGVEAGLGFGFVERGLTRQDFASSVDERKQTQFRPDLEAHLGVRANPILTRYLRMLLVATGRGTWESFDHSTDHKQYPSSIFFDGFDGGVGLEATLLHFNVGFLATLGERRQRILEPDTGAFPSRTSMRFSFGTSLHGGYRW